MKTFSAKLAIKREPAAVHDVTYMASYAHDHGEFAMQENSRTRISIQMIIHCGMGVILGAIFGLALILADQNIFQFIVSSSSPSLNMAVFIGYFSFLVGTGATMTGFSFTTIELDALKVIFSNPFLSNELL